MAQSGPSLRRTLRIGGRKLHFFRHPGTAQEARPGTVPDDRAADDLGWRPPLLLIHGAGGDYLQWPPRLRRLAATSVYALDLPGHGRSTGPGSTTVEGYTAVIHDFVTALGLPPLIVAGHSLGAAIALTFAHRHPKMTAGLGLLCAGPRLPVSPKLIALLESDLERATERIVAGLFGAETPERTRARTLAGLRACGPGVLLGDFLACAHFDLTETLPSIQVPSLVVAGTADRMVAPALSIELAAGLPNSQLVVLPEASHMVMVEHPGEVTKLFADFLDGWGQRV